MRLRMFHICLALAAAVCLFLVFIALGVAAASGLAAVFAAVLVAVIAYRVARNVLMRRRGLLTPPSV